MSKFIDLTGQQFGRLTVIGRDWDRKGRIYWFCICQCKPGYILKTSISGKDLQSGRAQSDGCISQEKNKERHEHNRQKEIGKIYNGGYIFSARSNKNKERAKTIVGVWCSECGEPYETNLSSLKQNHTKSCGCLNIKQRKKFIDLTGHKYNNLTVVECDWSRTDRTYWYVECDCEPGKILEKSVSGNSLRRNHIKSCGHLNREKTIERNKTKQNIINSTRNQKNREKLIGQVYPGGKIIRFCGNDKRSKPIVEKETALIAQVCNRA